MDSYEALRDQVMHGDGVSAGLALFLTRGMAIWMQVWKEYKPSTPRIISTKSNDVRVILPADLQGDLVMALVSLAVNARKECR